MTAKTPELIGRVIDEQDTDAARALAAEAFADEKPPESFADFIDRFLPGLYGNMTIAIFNCLCDGFDIARLNAIPVAE